MVFAKDFHTVKLATVMRTATRNYTVNAVYIGLGAVSASHTKRQVIAAQVITTVLQKTSAGTTVTQKDNRIARLALKCGHAKSVAFSAGTCLA